MEEQRETVTPVWGSHKHPLSWLEPRSHHQRHPLTPVPTSPVLCQDIDAVVGQIYQEGTAAPALTTGTVPALPGVAEGPLCCSPGTGMGTKLQQGKCRVPSVPGWQLPGAVGPFALTK